MRCIEFLRKQITWFPNISNPISNFLTLQILEFQKNPTRIFGIENGIRILLTIGVPEIGTKKQNSQPSWLLVMSRHWPWLWPTVSWVPWFYSPTLIVTPSPHRSSHATREHALLPWATLSKADCQHGHSQHVAHSRLVNRYCHVYQLGSYLSIKRSSSIWWNDAFVACCALFLSEVACFACQAMHFNWAVYSFLNGHFSSSIKSQWLPLTIRLACNTTKSGCSLFHEFANKATVFNSGNDLLNHIRASGNQSIIHGYLINSYCFCTSVVTLPLWKLQLSIVAQLCLIWLLSIAIAIVIPDHDSCVVKSFVKRFGAAHWKVSLQAVSYLDIVDSIAD